MKRITLLVFGALLATTALAGRQDLQSVKIVDTWDATNGVGRTAYGSFGASYNSANAVEFIGCAITSNASGIYAVCTATDPTGLTRSCTTANPKQIEILRELRADSTMLFQWSEDGSCRRVWVKQWSEGPPKR